MQHKYNIYPSLLDDYQYYLDAPFNYERTKMDIPYEDYEREQFKALMDKINRVPYDSEAADKGTAFNLVVDCIIHKCPNEKITAEKVYEEIISGDVSGDPEKRFADVEPTNKLIGLNVTYNKRTFYFSIDLVKRFAHYYTDALSQVYVEAMLPTLYGDVKLYGFIDELMPQSCHDIKTTTTYSDRKFYGKSQSLVYPYCLVKSGNDVRHFEYNITDFSEVYKETYVFDDDRDIPILTQKTEDFIIFLNENKHLITNKKIFNE